MGRKEQRVAALRGHHAELGLRRAHTEPEKAQCGADQDHLAEAQRQEHEDGADAVEAQIANDQRAVRQPDGAARLHVFLAHDDKRRRARDPRHVGNGRDRQRDDHRQRARTDDGRERKPEQDRWERQQDVDTAHDRWIKALEIGGDDTEHNTRAAAEQHGQEAGQQRVACAVEQAREKIASLLVCAEQEFRAATFHERRRQERNVPGLVGIIRRGPRRGHGKPDDRQQHAACEQNGRVARKPCEAPPARAGPRDRVR